MSLKEGRRKEKREGGNEKERRKGEKDGTGDILPGSEWVPGVEDL